MTITQAVTETPTLMARMRYLADTGHARADELRAAADRIDNANHIPEIVGAWAKARKLWCEITGEPLI